MSRLRHFGVLLYHNIDNIISIFIDSDVICDFIVLCSVFVEFNERTSG